MSSPHLRLPSEHIRQIAGCIDDLPSLSAFSRTSKQLFACAKRDLYRRIRVRLVKIVQRARAASSVRVGRDTGGTDELRFTKATFHLLACLEAKPANAKLVDVVEFYGEFVDAPSNHSSCMRTTPALAVATIATLVPGATTCNFVNWANISDQPPLDRCPESLKRLFAHSSWLSTWDAVRRLVSLELLDVTYEDTAPRDVSSLVPFEGTHLTELRLFDGADEGIFRLFQPSWHRFTSLEIVADPITLDNLTIARTVAHLRVHVNLKTYDDRCRFAKWLAECTHLQTLTLLGETSSNEAQLGRLRESPGFPQPLTRVDFDDFPSLDVLVYWIVPAFGERVLKQIGIRPGVRSPKLRKKAGRGRSSGAFANGMGLRCSTTHSTTTTEFVRPSP